MRKATVLASRRWCFLVELLGLLVRRKATGRAATLSLGQLLERPGLCDEVGVALSRVVLVSKEAGDGAAQDDASFVPCHSLFDQERVERLPLAEYVNCYRDLIATLVG